MRDVPGQNFRYLNLFLKYNTMLVFELSRRIQSLNVVLVEASDHYR